MLIDSSYLGNNDNITHGSCPSHNMFVVHMSGHGLIRRKKNLVSIMLAMEVGGSGWSVSHCNSLSMANTNRKSRMMLS